MHEYSMSTDSAPDGLFNTQAVQISPAKCHTQATHSRKDPFVFTKSRKLAFVESEDD